MGVSYSAPQLDRKLAAWQDRIERANTTAITATARQGQEIMSRAVVSAGWSQGAIVPAENRAGKPAKKTWRAAYKVTQGDKPEAYLFYRGPVHWLEGGTARHLVVSKKARRRMGRVGKNGPSKRQRTQAEALFGFLAGGGGAGVAAGGLMALPPGGNNERGMVRGGVTHPGTPARPFWQRSKRNVIDTATEIASDAQSDVVRSVFR